jgi:hypothetical protein
VDGSAFDRVTRFVATGAPRRGVLKFAFAALAGVTLGRESGEAKKKGEKKVKVCKCPTADATTCKTAKVNKSKAKKVAKKACATTRASAKQA